MYKYLFAALSVFILGACSDGGDHPEGGLNSSKAIINTDCDIEDTHYYQELEANLTEACFAKYGTLLLDGVWTFELDGMQASASLKIDSTTTEYSEELGADREISGYDISTMRLDVRAIESGDEGENGAPAVITDSLSFTVNYAQVDTEGCPDFTFAVSESDDSLAALFEGAPGAWQEALNAESTTGWVCM